MDLSINKIFQYFLFLIIIFTTVFNGGNSNLSIQLNFILISIFFLICIKNKKYYAHLRYFFYYNKTSILFYLIFLLYILFQIIPLNQTFLQLFSPQKYYLLSQITGVPINQSLSLMPSNTFYQLLNFISLFLIILILKMIFYNQRHLLRFLFFLSAFGAFVSSVAVLFYLNGNPDFYFIKNSHNKFSASGFFTNRTVFCVFLIFSLISSFEILKLKKFYKRNSNQNFFLRIYVRLFLILICIGIITSFSRVGNFLLIIVILFYFLSSIKNNDNKSFVYLLYVIIVFDIIILGFYFGLPKLIERFNFLQNEFSYVADENIGLNRINLIKFSIIQIKDYFLFGYGGGSFETLFQIKYENLKFSYADHSHTDLFEYFGEYGLIGSLIFLCSIFKFLRSNSTYSMVNILILVMFCIIFIFDFSLHVPITETVKMKKNLEKNYKN